jgi:hypothetical protein
VQADSMALEMAKAINDRDRVGELNNMIEYSRESVYCSRETLNTIRARHPQLRALAETMLDDARDGAKLLERERQTLRAQIIGELKATAKQHCGYLEKLPEIELSFFQIKPRKIERVELGVLTNVPSNANAPSAIEELARFDSNSGYLSAGTRLYRANVDAKLPSPDNDLVFKFSALAPPVETTLAPARLVLQDAFREGQVIVGETASTITANDSLPCALRLQMSMPVKFGSDSHDVRTISNAATSGGAPAL